MNDAELREMAREFLETWEREWNKPWREQLEPDLAVFAQRVRDETRAERDGEWSESIRDLQKRKAHNRDKAESMGRRNVASHRQSDVETCDEILKRMEVPRG